MPFTPTHMLAVLPVARYWQGPGIMPALLIGSMVPDWPLYVSLGPLYETTHSLSGIFTACLPLGLAITLLYLLQMRGALAELLPQGLRRRYSNTVNTPFTVTLSSLLILALAVCIGAASHITWDAFTHGRGWGVAACPELRKVWLTVSGIKFPGYMTLQHGSTFVGLPLLAIISIVWYRRAEVGSDLECVVTPGWRLFWTFAIVAIPPAILTWFLWTLDTDGLRSLMRAAYYGLTRGGFALIVLLVAYALMFYPAVRIRSLKQQTIDIRGQNAVARLLAEAAHADGSLDSKEQLRMVEMLVSHLKMEPVNALDLITRAGSVDDLLTARQSHYAEINRYLAMPQKLKVMSMLLEVIAVDGEKDTNEMAVLIQSAEALRIPDARLRELFDSYFQQHRP